MNFEGFSILDFAKGLAWSIGIILFMWVLFLIGRKK